MTTTTDGQQNSRSKNIGVRADGQASCGVHDS